MNQFALGYSIGCSVGFCLGTSLFSLTNYLLQRCSKKKDFVSAPNFNEMRALIKKSVAASSVEPFEESSDRHADRPAESTENGPEKSPDQITSTDERSTDETKKSPDADANTQNNLAQKGPLEGPLESEAYKGPTADSCLPRNEELKKEEPKDCKCVNLKDSCFCI